MWRWVRINKEIQMEDLEEILIGAAEDVRLKARVVQKYRKEYQLGSVKEVERPSDREVVMKGTFLPFAEITSISSDYGRFIISTFQHSKNLGVATKGEIERYLQAVSRRVDAYEPQAA